MKPIITFLSDFGLEDEWIAAVKGVVKKINPKVEVIDISHLIPSYDIRKGAFVLASTLPFMPKGVHLAVVDPQVGTKRKRIVIQTERGDYLVGPDNGLLIPAAKRLGGIRKVVEITNKKYMLEEVSLTFEGRDVFAPVASHLTLGTPLKNFGKELKRETLSLEPWERPKFLRGVLRGEIIDVDKFGTLRTNFEEKDLKEANFLGKTFFELATKGIKLKLPWAKTFGEVKVGEPLLTIDSSGYLSLAINQGNAKKEFRLDVEDKVVLS